MEDHKNSPEIGRRKKPAVRIGGGTNIGAVFLLGGALATAAFVSIFVRNKGWSFGKDRRRRCRSKGSPDGGRNSVFLDKSSDSDELPSRGETDQAEPPPENTTDSSTHLEQEVENSKVDVNGGTVLENGVVSGEKVFPLLSEHGDSILEGEIEPEPEIPLVKQDDEGEIEMEIPLSKQDVEEGEIEMEIPLQRQDDEGEIEMEIPLLKQDVEEGEIEIEIPLVKQDDDSYESTEENKSFDEVITEESVGDHREKSEAAAIAVDQRALVVIDSDDCLESDKNLNMEDDKVREAIENKTENCEDGEGADPPAMSGDGEDEEEEEVIEVSHGDLVGWNDDELVEKQEVCDDAGNRGEDNINIDNYDMESVNCEVKEEDIQENAIAQCRELEDEDEIEESIEEEDESLDELKDTSSSSSIAAIDGGGVEEVAEISPSSSSMEQAGHEVAAKVQQDNSREAIVSNKLSSTSTMMKLQAKLKWQPMTMTATVVIGALSALSSLSCSWFFGGSFAKLCAIFFFAKLCAIFFFAIVLSKIHA
ncbi:uncharacterized protein LOC127243064 [Andrographis paniculata]|uniref:uncharacterized protein LOC127243064 n=1 Tax=Andrographis paniculata TaxID=175694 RepID=UPI0021E787C6|nr:uncharacterized protein LOC127243064 [Andrographis paniculata]